MALTRIAEGVYHSPHFQMFRPKTQRGWYVVEARTDAGRALLAQATDVLPVREARKRVAVLEKQLAHWGQPLATPGATVAPLLPTPDAIQALRTLLRGHTLTGAQLVQVRETLFPGLSITQGQQRLATWLSMSHGHVRHMEKEVKIIEKRTVQLLRLFAERLLSKSRSYWKREEAALVPFAELFLAMEDTYDGRETDEPVRATVMDGRAPTI